MLAGRPYDPEKTDIWAIGVTLYAMLSGTLPFEHSSTKQLYDVINIGKYKELEHVSYSLRDLMRKMIEVDPKLRICFQKMKSHPWFSASPQKQLSNRFGLNEKVLAIMQSIFNIPQIDLRKQLKNKLSWTYLTYYHLLCKKIKTTNKNSLALMRKHEGPVHIKHIFKNFETAKIEVERTFAKTVWVSEFEAYGEEGVRVEIKSLANMCYLDWSKSAVEKWLRTK